ncbi:ATP-grasp fold amidoligase family protein [Campylobacter volucris]
MQTKSVGVVIPIYNVEKYLKECLDSVINQTYKNLQIILVNDGSTDENSLKIAKEYTLKDKRITLFDKENGGQSTARNVGIEYFSGEYKLKNITTQIKENSLIEFELDDNNPYNIYKVYKSYKAFNNEQDLTNFTYPIIDYIIFLDSDDYWELNCIEECVPRMDGVEVLWFDNQNKFEDNIQREYFSLLSVCNYTEGIITSEKWILDMHKLKMKAFWFVKQGMINFNFLKKIKLKFIDYIKHQDHCFGMILFFYAKFIYILPKILYIYRLRHNSATHEHTHIDKTDIPSYTKDIFKAFKKDVKKTRGYHSAVSWVISLMYLLDFIKKNTDDSKIIIFKSMYIPYIYENALKIFNYDRDPWGAKSKIVEVTNFRLENIFNVGQDFYRDFIFRDKYGSAKQRIRSQLSYRLGQIMLCSSKNFLDILCMPIYLMAETISYCQEKKIYRLKTKKDSSLVLPYIESYPDYQEAMQLKEHLSYRLGNVLIKSFKMWYKGKIFVLPFDMFKAYKLYKRNLKKNQNISINYNLQQLSDEEFHIDRFQKRFGYVPDFKNPQTFNEKLVYRILYDRNPIYTFLTDKLKARIFISHVLSNSVKDYEILSNNSILFKKIEYIKDELFATNSCKFLPKLYGIYDSIYDIDFKALPNSFVLKTNHDCGGYIIVKDKKDFLRNTNFFSESINKLNEHFKFNYYYKHKEWHYKNIEPKIFAEELLFGENEKPADTYKFHIFDHKQLNNNYIQFTMDRFDNYKRLMFDINWNLAPFNFVYENSCDQLPPKPNNFKEMLEISLKLSKVFDYVRVDLYSVKNCIYIGELTFTHGAASERVIPSHWDKNLGKLWKIKE